MRVDVTNIGIIQEASIQIDGITIIAAPNDCGKTTLLRLIYTLHDASNSTPSLVIKEYFARYFFQHIARIDHRFRFFINLPHFESGLRSEVIDFLYSGSIDKDSIENFTSVLIKQIESSLERNDFLFDHVGEKLKARDVGPLRKHIFDFFYEAKDKPLLDVEQYTSMLLSKMCGEIFSNRNVANSSAILFDVEDIDLSFGFSNETFNSLPSFFFPIDQCDALQTYYFEDLNLISERIGLNGERKIYGSRGYNHPHISKISKYLLNEPKKMQAIRSDFIDISRNFSLEKKSPNDNFLQFTKTTGKKKISLEYSNVPKGIRIFSFINKLLSNGYLNDEDVLIIDEPENHLHPAWQVKLATELFKLHSERGVRIVLATHSPIIIESFEKLSKGDEKINFYFGRKLAHLDMVRYDNCTEDTSLIYSSFMDSFRDMDKLDGSDF